MLYHVFVEYTKILDFLLKDIINFYYIKKENCQGDLT